MVVQESKDEIDKVGFMKMPDETKWNNYQLRGALINLLSDKCQRLEDALFKMGKGNKKV